MFRKHGITLLGLNDVSSWLNGAMQYTASVNTPVLVVPPYILTPNRFYEFRVQVRMQGKVCLFRREFLSAIGGLVAGPCLLS